MKIRQGFVSNSSSASYVVTLQKDFTNLNHLFTDIYDTCWCAIHDCENRYFQEKEYWELKNPPRARTTIAKHDIFRDMPITPPRVRVASMSNRLDEMESEELKFECITDVFDYEGIEVGRDSKGKFTLTHSTSMHNSFDDMSHLLKAIYFEYLICHGGADIKWESDN